MLAFKNKIIRRKIMSNILEISHLNYHNLYKNLSIQIEKNKFITISGPNNCGKTTLIRILERSTKSNSDIQVNNQNIATYKADEYIKLVQTIIPQEYIFLENTLEDEMYPNANGSDRERTELINYIVSGLKIKKILTKKVTTLTKKEIIMSQLAVALVSEPQLLLIDDLATYFTDKEINTIFTFLDNYREKKGLTLIVTTLDLNISLYTDYLYILNEGKVALEGKPLDVLEKDNIINKIGLALPFMIDLSVKLRDYDLVDGIEMDLDRMVDKLWN